MVGCGPEEGTQEQRVFRVTTTSDSSIVVYQETPEGAASLTTAGEVVLYEDGSNIVLSDAHVTLSADGEDVAAKDCTAELWSPPSGMPRAAGFDIHCEFTNAEVDALCGANTANIEVLARSNLGDALAPKQDLKVQCFEDTRMPEILKLTSEGTPPRKPCRQVSGNDEARFGYADGEILFVDEYSDGTFVTREAFTRNPDGTVGSVVTVDADAHWKVKRDFTYEDGVIVASTTESFGTTTSCTFSFTDGKSRWTRRCDNNVTAYDWDPAQGSLIVSEGADIVTLSYSGELSSPEQWLVDSMPNYFNELHPTAAEGTDQGTETKVEFEYNSDQLLVKMTTSIAGTEFLVETYEYSCD